MSTSPTQEVRMPLEAPLSTSLVNVGGYRAEVLLGAIVGQRGQGQQAGKVHCGATRPRQTSSQDCQSCRAARG